MSLLFLPTAGSRVRISIALCLGALSASAALVRADEGESSESTLAHGEWAFTCPRAEPLPEVTNNRWLNNPIDAFVLARLEAEGLVPNEPADRAMLLRRIAFDLTGLPPSIEAQERFLSDEQPGAYERMVDQFLSSPELGARWAQHWLDVVRYAETDGFKADVLRPNAFRYRDYVIRAFNQDLSYDDFVLQQLAGDEIAPDDPQALVATGVNRLYPDEDNAANLIQRRQEILDDITETTGLAFMGLTMGCAQCHDHKFDDILQEDYFKLQAFFTPFVERDDVLLASPEEKQAYQDQLAVWEEATRSIRAEIDRLLEKERSESAAFSLSKFSEEIQRCYLTPAAERTPFEEQIARIAAKQVDSRFKTDAAAKKLHGEQQARYQELTRQLAELEHLKPAPLPQAMAISDVGDASPPTHLLDGGDWKSPLDEVQPGFPVLFDSFDSARFVSLTTPKSTTGRRTELARWLIAPDHPLTARVIVNRIWHHHFGRGIVATPNDFGFQGDVPTHPELLDWLAVELMEHDWSLKHIHRLILNSATYRQSSTVDPTAASHMAAMKVDPQNSLLWHARRNRLEGEAIRDAMLSVSGQLNHRMFGESARPELPEGASKRYAWNPDERMEDQRRRSIFVLAKRNMRFPMFDAFDLPDMHNSCGARTESTTPPQALLMLNSRETMELAAVWARDLHDRFASNRMYMIQHAYATALGRQADADEVAAAAAFLESPVFIDSATVSANRKVNREVSLEAVTDFCHALFNCNEFVYID